MKKEMKILIFVLAMYFATASKFSGFTPSTENMPGLTLDSHSNRCFQKALNVKAGKINLSFNYRVTHNPSLRQSAVVVTIDGAQIYKIYPSESGKTINLSGDLQEGEHILAFCTLGCPSEAQHQAFISGIVIKANQCKGGWGEDLIVNGGFEQNDCRHRWCRFSKHVLSKKPNSVVGWTSPGALEIGHNSFFHRPSLGSGFVAYVQSGIKSFPTQKVSMNAGKYLLSFNWAPRYRLFYYDPSFQVRANGVCIKNIKLVDDTCRVEEIEFTVDRDTPDGVIEFLEDLHHCNSPLIDNVKLQRFDDCSSQKSLRM